MGFLYDIFGLGADRFNVNLFSDEAPLNCTYSQLVYFETLDDFPFSQTETILWLFAAMFAMSVSMAYLYYYVVDSPKFNRWYHWSLWLILSFLLVYGVSFWIGDSCASSALLSYAEAQKVAIDPSWWGYYDITSLSNSLALNVALWGILISLLTSYVIRFRSINCRKTPF